MDTLLFAADANDETAILAEDTLASATFVTGAAFRGQVLVYQLYRPLSATTTKVGSICLPIAEIQWPDLRCLWERPLQLFSLALESLGVEESQMVSL